VYNNVCRIGKAVMLSSSAGGSSSNNNGNLHMYKSFGGIGNAAIIAATVETHTVAKLGKATLMQFITVAEACNSSNSEPKSLQYYTE